MEEDEGMEELVVDGYGKFMEMWECDFVDCVVKRR